MNRCGLLLLFLGLAADAGGNNQRETQLDIVRRYPAMREGIETDCTSIAGGALRCDGLRAVLDFDSAGKLAGAEVTVTGIASEKECLTALQTARPSAKRGKVWRDGKVAPTVTTFFSEGNGLVITARWANNDVMGKMCTLRLCDPTASPPAMYCGNLRDREESL